MCVKFLLHFSILSAQFMHHVTRYLIHIAHMIIVLFHTSFRLSFARFYTIWNEISVYTRLFGCAVTLLWLKVIVANMPCRKWWFMAELKSWKVVFTVLGKCIRNVYTYPAAWHCGKHCKSVHFRMAYHSLWWHHHRRFPCGIVKVILVMFVNCCYCLA